MKSSIAKRCALIGVAALAAGLAVNQASAADPSDAEVRSIVVHYSDLNLSEAQDARVLYGRIQRAARVACGDVENMDLAGVGRYHVCVEQAVTNAVAQVRSPLINQLYAAQGQHPTRS